MTEFERKIEEELAKQKAELVKPNIVVCGGTGTGKSSLINRFFGIEVAKVGSGQPITKGMNKYEQENIPVIIYDTEGYEISSASKGTINFEEKIKPEIEKMNKGVLKEQVHLVWYCISITNHRVTNYDLENIEYFIKNRMKIAVVFTQCDNDEELEDGSGKDATEFRKIIKEKFPNINFFETSASNKDLVLDLDKLQEWSYEALDNDKLKESFISAQKVSISSKKDEAYKVVKELTVRIAGSAGLNPFPMSDTLLIVPQQIEMSIRISKIFGFDSFGENAKALLQSQLLSLAGKQLVTSLLKFIPVFGQVINASVAGAMSYALGSALTEVYAKAYKDYLDTGKLPNWMELFSSDLFMNIFSSKSEEYKNNKKD
jgi:uncharacterized protein (DUF697 family)/GTP-binding protein EngB required for normal cell division